MGGDQKGASRQSACQNKQGNNVAQTNPSPHKPDHSFHATLTVENYHTFMAGFCNILIVNKVHLPLSEQKQNQKSNGSN